MTRAKARGMTDTGVVWSALFGSVVWFLWDIERLPDEGDSERRGMHDAKRRACPAERMHPERRIRSSPKCGRVAPGGRSSPPPRGGLLNGNGLRNSASFFLDYINGAAV